MCIADAAWHVPSIFYLALALALDSGNGHKSHESSALSFPSTTSFTFFYALLVLIATPCCSYCNFFALLPSR